MLVTMDEPESSSSTVDLPDVSQSLDAYLEDHEGVLRWKAGNQTSPDFDDLVQEARIAVWLALAEHPDATRSYLDQAATWRIRGLQRGEGFLGTRGRRSDPLKTPHAGSDGVLAMRDEVIDESSLDDLDRALLSYHQDEILAAVADLPEIYRTYVVLRFWGMLDRQTIGRMIHKNPGNLATTWRVMIIPVLKDRLAHLSGLVI